MQANQLSAEFAIPGVLSFTAAPDGLVKASMQCAGAEAELFLQGAQLTQWCPQGERPALFVSPLSAFAPAKAIRGGIPVIFPWFGPHPSDPGAPQHGFARTAPWRLRSVERAPSGEVTLRLDLEADSTAAGKWWDAPIRLAYTLTIGRRLRLELTATNLTERQIAFEAALHSYFAVSEASRAVISGLAGCLFIDKVDGMRRKREGATALTLDGETDRVYLDTPDRLVLTDPAWQRQIAVTKQGAGSAIVWNPWREKAQAMADLGDPAWRGMICLEVGNVADNAVRLAGGATHTMSVEIDVAA